MFHEVTPEVFINLSLILRVKFERDAKGGAVSALVQYGGITEPAEYRLSGDQADRFRKALWVLQGPG